MQIAEIDKRTVRRGDQEYEQDTTNIGKSKSPEPEAETACPNCGGTDFDGDGDCESCREPDVIEVDPDDPVAYVLSLNLHRRNLDQSQKAMVAARAREHYEGEAKERERLSPGRPKKGASIDATLSPPRKAGDHRSDRAKTARASSDAQAIPRKTGDRGRASEHAGKVLGVSGASVDRARRVIEHGSGDLIDAVENGQLTVSRAASVVDLPKPKQLPAATTKPEPQPKGKRATEGRPAGAKPADALDYARCAITQLQQIRHDDPADPTWDWPGCFMRWGRCPARAADKNSRRHDACKGRVWGR